MIHRDLLEIWNNWGIGDAYSERRWSTGLLRATLRVFMVTTPMIRISKPRRQIAIMSGESETRSVNCDSQR